MVKKDRVLEKYIKSENIVTEKKIVDSLEGEEAMSFIEELSQYITVSPEKRISHINSLMHLCESNYTIIAKASLLSLLQIFKLIMPLYQINQESLQKQLSNPLQKDQRHQVIYELKLVEFYHKYIKILQNFFKLKTKTYSNDKNDQIANIVNQYRYTSLRCFIGLLENLSHLDESQDMLKYILPRLGTNNQQQREILNIFVKNTLSSLNPNSLKLKIVILKEISVIINQKSEDNLADDFLDVVQYTVIDFKHNQDQQTQQENLRILKQKQKEQKKQKFKDEKDKKNKKNNNNNNKQNNNNKEDLKQLKKDVENTLKETDATVMESKQIAKLNQEILQKLMYIYFKLIRGEKITKFFQVAINGLLKIIHLVDVKFVKDTIESINSRNKSLRKSLIKFTEKQDKQDKQKLIEKVIQYRLSCIFASDEIVTKGPGKIFDISNNQNMMHFYEILFDIKKNKIQINLQEQQLIVRLLSKLFIQKREFSIECVASFIKIVSELALQFKESKIQKTFLFFLSKIFQKYPITQKMIEDDNQGYGINSFRPEMDDPQLTNAINSSIFDDIQQIYKQTKDQQLQAMAQKVMKNERYQAQQAAQDLEKFFLDHN